MRNIAHELKEMGIEEDDAEYQELEKKDRARQKEACYQQYTKDIADYIAWKKANQLGQKPAVPSSGRLRDMILAAQSDGPSPVPTKPAKPSKGRSKKLRDSDDCACAPSPDSIQ